MSTDRKKDKLHKLKEKIEESYDFFKENYDRYNLFYKETFEDSRSQASIDLESVTNIPSLEFNIFKPFVDELIGRFVQQNPSLRAFGTNGVAGKSVQIIEGHLRYILDNCEPCLRRAFEESTAGGFSVLKVCTDYRSSMSFDQSIFIEKAFNPTLCYFDKNAVSSHKGDGEFSGEMIPMNLEQFAADFGEKETRDIVNGYGKKEKTGKSSFSRFKWNFKSGKVDYILVCDHYEKTYKKKRILEVQVPGNLQVMFEDDYEALIESLPPDLPLEMWPRIVNERMTVVDEITRYLLTDEKILKTEKTSYPYLPHVFVTGNSKVITDSGGQSKEMTLPYVYTLRSMQQLKNLSMSLLGNDMQNVTQSLAMIPQEGIPDNDTYRQALLNPQQASIIVYKSRDDETQQPLPPPQSFPRNQLPSYVQQFFYDSGLPQMMLGNYFHQLANPGDNLSGKAIEAGDMASHGAASPYISNFIGSSLGQIAKICVKLMPLYYRTGQTIPIKKSDGTRQYYTIKDDGEFDLHYKDDEYDVEIKPGLSSVLQKREALRTTLDLMKICPVIQEFICTTREGINYLLSNVESRGVDSLREMVDQFVDKYNQQQQQKQILTQQEIQKNQQQLQAQDPNLLKKEELQVESQKNAQNHQYRMLEAYLKNEATKSKHMTDKEANQIKFIDSVSKRMEVEGKLALENEKIMTEKEKLEAEEYRANELDLNEFSRYLSKIT